MAWERGYYYRSHKVAGRVVREYLGNGTAAQVIAQFDAERRRAERARAQVLAAEYARLKQLENGVELLCARVELLARAALLVAGYHRPKRGKWRRRRGRR